MTNYLEVKNLSKSFDSFQLHNISFTLPKGYIMGLDNIADEQKAKAELGVVFDTNCFSDDWQVTQVGTCRFKLTKNFLCCSDICYTFANL